MIRSLQWLLLSLVLTSLISFQVYAQEVEPRQTRVEQRAERIEDRAEYARQDNIVDAQLDRNTAAIAEQARMTGTQDFILKLVGIVSALLTPMIAGLLLYMTQKQKVVAETRSIAARDDLILVSRSVNGMKTELVARAELNAFMEATHLSETGKMTRNAEIRLAELQEAVKYATAKAEALAVTAVEGLETKQNGRTSVAKIVPLAHGEQKVVEGVDFGDAPINPDAIPVAGGEAKAVVGMPA